jgi:hypothetical protein
MSLDTIKILDSESEKYSVGMIEEGQIGMFD